MNQLSFLKKRSPIHGLGMFAMSFIPKGTTFYSFTPIIVSQKPLPKFARVSEKIFVSDEILDFVNHSCEPNCETDIIRGRIWVIALRDIKKGEELAYNYGYGLDTFEDHPCRCGSNRCMGYIVEEEQWPKLKRILKNRSRNKARIIAR